MSEKGSVNGNPRYAEERYNPKVPICAQSNISLAFDGNALTMRVKAEKTRVYSYSAVSGKPNAQGRFVYAVSRQKKSFEGPIPQAEYWINPSELWGDAWYKFWVSSNAWGDYRIAIHPYPTSKTYGRGGFFIHGGREPGSAGCIDLTKNISRFVQDLLREVNGDKNCFVPLSVKYK